MKIPARVALSILLLVVALGAAVVLATREDRIVGLGEEVRDDDFGFTVVSWSETSSPGPVVKLRVANHAKRVPYRFVPEMAVLKDGPTTFPAGRHAVRASPTLLELPPGGAGEIELTFDTPGALRSPSIRLTDGNSPLFELLHVVVCGDRRIALRF